VAGNIERIDMDVEDIIADMSGADMVAMQCRIVHISSRWRQRLTDNGLLNKAGNDWTELGLAVRKALMEMSDGS
jgi:hypothetical protein